MECDLGAKCKNFVTEGNLVMDSEFLVVLQVRKTTVEVNGSVALPKATSGGLDDLWCDWLYLGQSHTRKGHVGLFAARTFKGPGWTIGYFGGRYVAFSKDAGNVGNVVPVLNHMRHLRGVVPPETKSQLCDDTDLYMGFHFAQDGADGSVSTEDHDRNKRKRQLVPSEDSVGKKNNCLLMEDGSVVSRRLISKDEEILFSRKPLGMDYLLKKGKRFRKTKDEMMKKKQC